MVRLTDRPDMTLDVYRGRKTTMQKQQQLQGTERLSLQTQQGQCNWFKSGMAIRQRCVCSSDYCIQL